MKVVGECTLSMVYSVGFVKQVSEMVRGPETLKSLVHTLTYTRGEQDLLTFVFLLNKGEYETVNI